VVGASLQGAAVGFKNQNNSLKKARLPNINPAAKPPSFMGFGI